MLINFLSVGNTYFFVSSLEFRNFEPVTPYLGVGPDGPPSLQAYVNGPKESASMRA